MSYTTYKELKKKLAACADVAARTASSLSENPMAKTISVEAAMSNDGTVSAKTIIEQKDDDDKWKKSEMCLYKNSIAALAAAVIRQWKIDGEPKISKSMIDLWYAVYKEAIFG